MTWHTPHDVHHGHTDAVNTVHAEVLTVVYKRHPEPAALPTGAWINAPSRDQKEH
ncbi:hypothetical protein [Streptomyces sp. NPDC002276]